MLENEVEKKIKFDFFKKKTKVIKHFEDQNKKDVGFSLVIATVKSQTLLANVNTWILVL
jgi:hypothetical protein